jgi:hypothetical protein
VLVAVRPMVVLEQVELLSAVEPEEHPAVLRTVIEPKAVLELLVALEAAPLRKILNEELSTSLRWLEPLRLRGEPLVLLLVLSKSVSWRQWFYFPGSTQQYAIISETHW